MILLALMLTAVILMVCTSVYIERVQYLLPYLVAFAAGIYQQNNGRAKMEPGPVKTVLLVSMMLWAVILSVFTRTVLAFNGKENRNRNIVYDAAASLIGNGNYKVFAPYEFYYAGRSLGWKMYGAYIPRKDSFSVSILQNLLPRVDYVIDRSASQLSPEFKAELEKEDLREEKTYDSYKEPLEKFDGKTTNIVRLQNLYSIFPRPYGPYKMYERGAGYTGLNEGQ
jgi:hypothetical protein